MVSINTFNLFLCALYFSRVNDVDDPENKTRDLIEKMSNHLSFKWLQKNEKKDGAIVADILPTQKKIYLSKRMK
jgi:hypothetical protein